MSKVRRNQVIGVKAGTEHRNSCRYVPVVSSVILGWGWGISRAEIPVDLVDISLQGCMVKSKVRPQVRVGEPVWFKVTMMHASDWVEGRVVAVQKPLLRKCEIRIKFVAALSFQVFQLLVYGRSEEPLEPVARPMHETDQWWR